MILIFPLLLASAGVLVWRRRAARGVPSGRWFGAWAVSGALVTFSLLTGLSIGLFVLPFAAAALLWTAARSTAYLDTLGFLAGAAFVFGIVSPLAGTVVCAVALVTYYVLSRDGEKLSPRP